MSLQLQIIHIPEGELLADTLYRIPAAGGLIGRAPECTVPLPDKSRFLSGRHARVLQEDSQWLVEDLSTNGLLVNNASAPLGPGKRHPLTDGDILTCGDYRIMVNLFSPEVSLTSGLKDTFGTSSLPECPSDDDPFSASPAQFTQTTTMVLDDPFNDRTSGLPSAELSHPSEPDSDQTESISLDRQQEAPSIDQLTRNYQPAVHNPDSSHLIDVLGDARETSIATGADRKVEASGASRDTFVGPETDVQQPGFTSAAVSGNSHAPALTSSSHNTVLQLQEENRQLREQLKKASHQVRKEVYHAMGQALEQTLMDFSPEYLEKLFDDYSGKKRGRFGKRNNWELYSRHFHRTLKEQTCRLTFTARFQEALHKLQEKTP